MSRTPDIFRIPSGFRFLIKAEVDLQRQLRALIDLNRQSQHIYATPYPFFTACVQEEIPLSVSTYSYLIGETVTLLNEDEWKTIEPFAKNRIERIQEYRKMHGCGLKEAIEKEDFGQEALDKYEQLTGVRLSHPDQIWAVRMTSYGSLCPECQRPFRSSKAKLCEIVVISSQMES